MSILLITPAVKYELVQSRTLSTKQCIFWARSNNEASVSIFGSYILVQGLRDELSLTVDAGVGALAGDLLLLLGDAAWWRGRPTCV